MSFNIKDFVNSYPKILPKASAVRARAVMRKNNIRALPVFENNKLIGIITRSDILKITSTKSNITVGGLLWRPVIKVDSNTNLQELVKIMVKTKIKQVPIFENNKYLGLIRDLDLMRAILDKNVKPKKKLVRDVMSKKVRRFTVKDTIDKVWFSLKEHSGSPVLDKNKVVGIITSKEILNSKKARLARSSKGLRKAANVETVMRTIKGNERDFLINSNSKVDDAIKKFLKTEVSILPVVDERLVGVVTKRDILRAYV